MEQKKWRFWEWSAGIIVILVGLVSWLWPSLLFSNYAEISINNTGRVNAQFTQLAGILILLAILMEFVTAVIAFRSRVHKFAIAGTFLLFAASMIEPISILRTFSIPMFTATLGRVLLTYAVLDDNLFHLLLDGNKKLEMAYARVEKEVQARTNSLNAALQREKKLSENLELAMAQEVEFSQLKSRIINIVSHEFRTPLAVINSSTDLIERSHKRLKPEKRASIHQRIRNSIFYLDDLLQDILFVEKENREGLQIQPSDIFFDEFIQNLKTTILKVPDETNRIVFIENPSLSQKIQTDSKLVSLVGHNLVSNALKYSDPPHKVEITFNSSPSTFIMQVKDVGIGIPQTELSQIYEMFYRAENVEQRRGIGLGLYTAKTIVNGLNGRISAASAGIGQGATFTVEIPLTLQESDFASHEQKSIIAG